MKPLAWILAICASAVLTSCSSDSGGNLAKDEHPAGRFQQFKASLRFRLTDGGAQLQKAYEAKQKARSWKMRTEMRFHPGEPLVTISEVSCPDSQHMTGKVGPGEYELFRISGMAYLKGPDGAWQSASGPADMVPCGSAAGYPAPWAMLNEGRDPATALALLSKANVPQIRRGLLLQVEGITCQEWQVSFGHPGSSKNSSAMMQYNVCLDYETNLPKRIAMSSGAMVMTYYDWDQPISITKPM